MASHGSLSRTPLYGAIAALQPRLTDFAGWEMPIQFTSIAQEHQAVRQASGIFDISHMGRFVLRGPGLMTALQSLVPSDLASLQPGAAQYTVLLNEQGGILDDLIVYYQGQEPDGTERALLIVNAVTRQQDYDWIAAHLANSALELRDESLQSVLLAVQGPEALALLQPHTDLDLAAIQRYGHREGRVLGQPAFVARTGYTGEDGFEVMVPSATGLLLWQQLVAAGMTPCGLGARDTLRLEAAMALYGQDVDAQTTPWEAGLGWLVHLDRKGDFIGRAALEAQQQTGVPRRLVGIQMEGRNIARHGYPVLAEGMAVGIVTSGTWAPSLERAIALAYVPPHLAKVGQAIAVEIRGKACPGTVVKRPFYRRSPQ